MRDTDTGIYMENETLGNFARNTASALENRGSVSGGRTAAGVYVTLRRLKSRLAPASGSTGFSRAREWFTDNWYIMEREAITAARQLNSIGRLPMAAGTGRAAVMEAAGALVRAGRGQVTAQRVRLFLDEYQKIRVLTERELAAFVPALRAELVAFLDQVYPAKLREIENDAELSELAQNIFTSLRLLSSVDLSGILEEVNRVESALRNDPAGVYTLMDEETRGYYRTRLAKLSRRERISEFEAAKKALELANKGPERHVGYYIFTKPLGHERKRGEGGWYIACVVLATVFFSLLAGMSTGSAAAAVLCLLPVSEIVKNVLDFALLRLTRPTHLPAMELEGGIPRVARTICVISALLTGEADGPKYAGLMEEYRLLNRDAGENLLFGILADLPESKTKLARDDARILDSAKRAVDGLNEKYGGGFYLLARDRQLNEADNIWMGRERKRGAIEDLTRLLSGEKSDLRPLAGDGERLSGCAYILTLDADTRLTSGSAKELVGAALHPLNTPVIDEKLGRVVSGYGIFEPRVAVDLRAAGRSDFARVFAGEGGVDPYSSAVSDLYQDLFDEGTFMGKGLINVPVYKRLLDGVLPDNTVLSHDILEGGYLRCAFASKTELTDGWPYKVTSYFTRQERWTRGDWQNIRWCTGRVQNREGALVRNTLTAINRWKLVDNLRRSLVPTGILLPLLAWAAAGSTAMGVCAVVALAALLSPLLLTCGELLARHDGSTRARYQSSVISGLAGAILRTAIRILLLPAEAWIQLRAAATAIFRMTVTKKKLLSWVTSSEAERRQGNTLKVNYKALIACPALGILTLIFTRNPLAGALAVLWLFAPAYAWAISREIRPVRCITGQDRSYLLSCAGNIWRYFAENLTPEDNYLPPDNIQTEPDLGAAHRTSPTNIGLAMLSCVAAADLGLIGEAQAAGTVKNILNTVEKLTKWNGHLLNWYDTRTLTPLEPRYVSTVDSGNLMGCLITLKQWFLKLGDTQSAERCWNLCVGTDLRPLFDKRRKLFHIGYDLTKDALTEGWYDLLASEARATSYIAVALGQVPRKHWRRLGRALVSLDRYSGMASWTGTMFEYLMPNLILPCPENSLIYESSRFCLYAQKRAHSGIPWGISESAYYAFDPGLSYRYKAHGVQRLALKRGMEEERVISPYSSFLALPLDAAGAVRNLKRLEAFGLTGRYGFFEAADFTRGRTQPGKPQPVRCFMAHHLGMSLIAIANTLCGDVFPRRFMAEASMAAYRELLEERLPVGKLILRQPPRDVPQLPRRAESGGFREELSETDALEPRGVPLSNGTYTVVFSETGHSRSVWRGLELTRFEPEPGGSTGMELWLRDGEKLIPLTPAPAYDGSVRYKCELTDGYGKIKMKKGELAASMTVTVPPSGAGEMRTVDVLAQGDKREVTVLCVFEPVLQRREDYLSHPAFSRLALEASLSGNVLTVRRRPKPGGEEACLALTSDGEMTVTTHRLRGDMPETGELLRSSPDMRVCAAVPVRLNAGRGRVTLCLAPGRSPQEAAAEARGHIDSRENPAISRISAAALMLGMTPSDVRDAMALMPSLTFGTPYSEARRACLATGGLSRENLWEYGVSGELPVLAAKIEGQSQIDGAKGLILRHALLRENGAESDLVLLITDGGDYRSAQREAILETLRSIGAEDRLGTRGGVRIVDATAKTERCFMALASAYLRLDAIPAQGAHRGRTPEPARPYIRGSGEVKYALTGSGALAFVLGDALPWTGWSHILTNGSFGALMTETGAGYMWQTNSRLMKLTPAPTDPTDPRPSETLKLSLPDMEPVSLFADGSGAPTAVEYGFGYARWERELGKTRTRVTAFVPNGVDVRILIVELAGEFDGGRITYRADLAMGEDNRPDPALRVERSGDCFETAAVAGAFRGTVFRVLSSEPPESFTCDGDEAMTGAFTGRTGAFRRPCIAMTVPARGRLVIAAGCVGDTELRRAAGEADRLFRDTEEYWREFVSRVEVRTGDKRIDAYAPRWAAYQVYACRLLARTGLYQNGGAVGFRDQLQDACALTDFDQRIPARQIRLAASRQYREGDVMHWWHDTPAGPMGVRTRCSDDLLWLPWALCDYVERTGDAAICRQTEPYLVSEPLSDTEHDRYERPVTSAIGGTILEHAIRACDKFLARGRGGHGLALILSGDWNDGFDGLGREGRGESTWLTFFASMVLRSMAGLCRKQGEGQSGDRFSKASGELLRAGENTWTGHWYLRAWDDAGRPIGAPGCDECELDSLPQSFAYFAGADRARCREALIAAYDRLYDPESRTVKLFDPPFDAGETQPGYIKTYAPGFRENGGQYTHAAVWLAMALRGIGEAHRANTLLSALSPWGRDARRYAAEPNVIAADVYTCPGHVGRAGWTWYTGSAGWYLRAVTSREKAAMDAGAL